MRRRDLLVALGASSSIPLTGCFADSEDEEREADTPVSIEIVNVTEEDQTLDVAIEREEEVVFADVFELPPGDGIKSDHAFYQPGAYEIGVQTAEREETDVLEVTWDHLEDCNAKWFAIMIAPEEIQIDLMSTLMACDE